MKLTALLLVALHFVGPGVPPKTFRPAAPVVAVDSCLRYGSCPKTFRPAEVRPRVHHGGWWRP